MMKFRHKYNHEIVFVVGFYVNGKGSLIAGCLCDSRLHPFNKKQLRNGSVFIPYPHADLEPVDSIDWDSVNEECYENGAFEKMVEERQAQRRKDIEGSAVAVYQKEKRQCLADGMPDDVAESIAQRKKAEFIEEKMKPLIRLGTPLKGSNW